GCGHTALRAPGRGPLAGALQAGTRGGFRQLRPWVEAFGGREAAARPRTLSPLPAPAASKLTLAPAWKALAAARKKIAAANLADLFAADPSRAERFLIEAGGLVLDYSTHRVDAEAMRLLAGLAAQAQVPRWLASMFAGDPINSTAARAVLHVALRSEDTAFPERGDVVPAVRSARERRRGFVDEVQRGTLKGSDGRTITDVVNIGIGGSDLGPRMLARDLSELREAGPNVHLVSHLVKAEPENALPRLLPGSSFTIVY